MGEEKEWITEVLKELQDRIEFFYQQKNGEALSGFDSVLDRLLAMIDRLFQYKESHPEFPLDEARIRNSLTEAMEALQKQDFILLADVIQYDFIEYVNTLIE